MILKKNEIKLQFLGEQVLDLCPYDASSEFVDGFLNFVAVFFDELDVCSEPFLREDWNYDVDLEDTLELTMKTVYRTVIELDQRQQKLFLEGVLLAQEQSFKVLKLAYGYTNVRERVA